MWLQQRVLAVLVFPFLLAASALAGGDWTGKTVLVKKVGIKIGHAGADGKVVYLAELTSTDYRVLEEKGSWLRVRQDNVDGWFEKKDAVVLEEAVQYFTNQIKSYPSDAGGYSDRGEAWRLRGDFDAAMKDYNDALRLAPSKAVLWNNRGVCWVAKKDYDKALIDFGEAIRLDATKALFFNNRADAWTAKKDYAKSIKDSEESIRLSPKSPHAYNSIAWILATCMDDKIRDGKRAVKLATQACELTKWGDGDLIDSLAAAYAEAGQFEEAVKYQRKVLEDPALSGPAGNDYRARLELYKQKKPFRDPG